LCLFFFVETCSFISVNYFFTDGTAVFNYKHMCYTNNNNNNNSNNDNNIKRSYVWKD